MSLLHGAKSKINCIQDREEIGTTAYIGFSKPSSKDLDTLCTRACLRSHWTSELCKEHRLTEAELDCSQGIGGVGVVVHPGNNICLSESGDGNNYKIGSY